MILKDCYDMFGGNYESVTQRISRDEMIEKFVLKFLSEPSYDVLCRTLEDGDYAEAFRAVHSLKGVCQNLGFVRLEYSTGILTELLRNSSAKRINKEQCKQALQQVSADYKEVIDAVRRYVVENGMAYEE